VLRRKCAESKRSGWTRLNPKGDGKRKQGGRDEDKIANRLSKRWDGGVTVETGLMMKGKVGSLLKQRASLEVEGGKGILKQVGEGLAEQKGGKSRFAEGQTENGCLVCKSGCESCG
jgi:hypothetical protein